MPLNFPIQANLTRGELAPKMHGRIDVDHYKAGTALATNFTIMREGGMRRRPGFKMVKEVKDSSAKTRLLPFVFGVLSTGPQAYVIEAGNNYMRFFANGGIILRSTTGGTPTAITKANPGVVTLNAHGFVNGDPVYATGIGGMVELNNREFIVAGATANTFQLSGVNTSAYTAFTAGGTIRKIVELATSYVTADLPLLDYAQSADTLFVTHASYAPKDITRTADDVWTSTTPVFKDGPYLDEPIQNGNGVTPNINNAIHPLMTSNTLPSGTVTSGTGSANAYRVFDRDAGLGDLFGSTTGYWEYQMAAAATVVVNNYWIQGPNEEIGGAPCAWLLQAWDGAAYVTIDERSNQISWGGAEKRYFDFLNTVAFSRYRLAIKGNNGGTSGGNTNVQEIAFGYNGDYAPTMTLTFDTTTNINDGAGFTAPADVGRNIRLRGADGKWRYFVIVGVSSTKVVTGRMYGYPLPDLSKIYRWKLGAWKQGQYPAKVTLFQARRCLAKSNKEPYAVWMSKSFDFFDMGTSDPLVADDSIRNIILSSQLTSITWLTESERLTIGTLNNIRQMEAANTQAGFGATNQEQRLKAYDGATDGIKPVSVGSVLLFADYYKRAIREFVYELNQDGYVAPDISVLSRHLFKSGIVDMAFQKQPDATMWIVTEAGHLVAMTYDREQKILGFTKVSIAGGDPGTSAVVESVCCIPSSSRTEVYIIVKRTIGGVTKRYIEQLAAELDEDDAIDTCNFLDSSLQYNGAATGTVTGLFHLAGLTVDALADSVVYKGLTVSATGSVTLPNAATASKWTIGLRYQSLIRTLPLTGLGPDGVKIGRRIMANQLYIDVLYSLALRARGLRQARATAQSAYFDVWKRDSYLDSNPNYMTPRTGVFPLPIDGSTADRGQFEVFSEDPLPVMIRAFIIGNDGDP